MKKSIKANGGGDERQRNSFRKVKIINHSILEQGTMERNDRVK